MVIALSVMDKIINIMFRHFSLLLS